MSRVTSIYPSAAAESLAKQIIPFEELVPGTAIPISELSSLTFRNHDGNSEVTIVGDGGYMYHARVHLQAHFRNNTEQVEFLEFHEAYKLEVPPDQPFIDAESIGSYCPLSTKNCTYIIGAERDNATASGIYEYDDKGNLLSDQPFEPLQHALGLLGFSGDNQVLNQGFEALTITPDNALLIFTTEGALKTDTNKAWRRIVFFNIEENEATIFKYAMENPDHGISDIATLDNFGNHFAVLERNKNSSKIYHSYIVVNIADSFKIDLSDTSQWNPEMVTERFAGLRPLILFPEKPFYDDTNEVIKDNNEGLLLVDASQGLLLMVTDNNENLSEKTIISLLGIETEFIVQTREVPGYLTFGFYLLLLCAVCALVYCFLSVTKKRGNRHYHDNIMDSTDIPSDMGSSNVEMSSTIRREERIQLT